AHRDGRLDLWPQAPFALAAAPPSNYPIDGPVTLKRHESASLSGTVIFPITRPQSNGVEDLRLVTFVDDDGSTTYFGTYTAYSGRDIGCEIMQTDRFAEFGLPPLRGPAAKHKGLALFPRRINGRFAAIGRLDHESLSYLETDDHLNWNTGQKIMTPKYP